MPSSTEHGTNRSCNCNFGACSKSSLLNSARVQANTSRVLAFATALCLAATLLYVFVLLVPAWRTVQVDSDLIGALLANSTTDEADDIAKQREVLKRDPLLHNRTANAFRECLLLRRDTKTANSTSNQQQRQQQQQWQANNSSHNLMSHMLEILAGTINATTMDGRNQSAKVEESSESPDHCWFIDLRWSSSAPLSTDSPSRIYLDCIRALFLLAVGLLMCYCVSLTGTLYACFAGRLPGSCLFVLLLAHCLTLSQLVATAILQDKSAHLEIHRLQSLLTAGGFPDRSGDAVSSSRGNWCLALLCALCCLTACQMLLLLLLLPSVWTCNKSKTGIYRQCHSLRQAADPSSTDAAESIGKGNEDTNPLL